MIKNTLMMAAAAMVITGCAGSGDGFRTYSKKELAVIRDSLGDACTRLSERVIMPAEGYLKYPYLIPAGFYKQMWDWDGFFMGKYFVSVGKPEYLKYWALNFMEGVDGEGYVSGCATTVGPRPIFGKFSMKPFLSQGTYIAAEALGDYSWVKENYGKLKSVTWYRERMQQDSVSGLFFWQNGFQSGADNNVALNYFPTEDTRRFLACDASAFQLREYEALAAIAERIGEKADADLYGKKAVALKAAINKYLWCDEDKMYYNVDMDSRDFYKRVSYSCFMPLTAGTLSQEDGKAMISKHLLDGGCMKSQYGFRSLSRRDPDYNNKNIIVPFSNWQGPIWMVANYLYAEALEYYGFDDEIDWLAGTLGELLLKDIAANDTMHENYSAETGDPLAPSDDYVDSTGKIVGFVSWNLCVNNLLDAATGRAQKIRNVISSGISVQRDVRCP